MKLKLLWQEYFVLSVCWRGSVRLEPVFHSVKDSHPEIYAGWCTEDGRLRSSLPVFVNGEHIRYKSGLQTELCDGDEVYIVPLIAGG